MSGRVVGLFFVALVVAFALTCSIPDGADAKSRKSGRSEKSDKSGRSGKSGKSGKSAKSRKSGKGRKTNKSRRSGKSCKSGRCEPGTPPAVCEPGQLADVSVELTDAGDLLVTGDACHGNVTLRPGEVPDEFTISVAEGGALEGVAGPVSAVVTGVIGDVFIDMGAGNDAVNVERVDLPGDLHIQMGEGDNTVRFLDVDVAGDASLLGGDGIDVFSGPSIRIVGSMLFSVGAGLNRVILDLTTGGDLSIRTGDDDDLVRLADGSGASGDLSIEVGHGQNKIQLVGGSRVGGELEVRAGDGNDLLEILNCAFFTGDVTVDLGVGDDQVFMEGAECAQALSIFMGKGLDEVTFRAAVRGTRTCLSSVGGDTVLDLGEDEDMLSTEDTTFGGAFVADGGDGFDVRFELMGSIYVVVPVFLRFEAVELP